MKPLYILFIWLCFICLSVPCVTGQVAADSLVLDSLQRETIDSIEAKSILKKEKKGSIFSGRPGKSMLMSLVIPGAGQIYNKSYLRVPFVWGAVGGMGLLVNYNTVEYQCRKAAYEASVDGVPYVPPCKDCPAGLLNITDPGRLKALRDEANNARQLSIVGLSLVWLANGIDAFVNAHLKEFDIDEDLSIRVGTKFDNDPNSPMRMGIFVDF